MGIKKRREAERKAADEKKKDSELPPRKKVDPATEGPVPTPPKPKDEEEVGRVAVPVEKEEAEARPTVPEEETPAKESEEEEKPLTQTAVGGATPKTPEEIKELEQKAVEANKPDAKKDSEIYEQAQKHISRKKLDEALRLAKQIKNPAKMNELVENIADTYAVNTFDSGKGDYSKALSVAKNIKDDLFYSRVLKEIVEEWQIEDKNPDNVLDAEKTLRFAEKAAERADTTKKEDKEKRKKLLGEIYDLKIKLETKIKHSRNLTKLKKSRSVKFAAKVVGEVVAGLLATGIITAVVYTKSCINGEKKPEKEPVTAVVELDEDGIREDFSLLKDEYIRERQNRFPELENWEVDVKALKGQRKMEDIEMDIGAVEGILEVYSDEAGKKKKLNKAQEEVVTAITKNYTEAKLADEELDEVEKDGIKLAFSGEDEELLKILQKEALKSMLAELQLERTEAEKLKTYLESEEVMEAMKADLCPVSPIDPSREGNGVCDRNPVKKFVGKDGEVMYVSVPYDEKELCPSEPCTKKGEAAAKRDSKTW